MGLGSPDVAPVARPVQWFQRRRSQLGPYRAAFGWQEHARPREARLYATPAGLQVEVYAVEPVTGRAGARRADPLEPVYLLFYAGTLRDGTIEWHATKYAQDVLRARVARSRITAEAVPPLDALKVPPPCTIEALRAGLPRALAALGAPAVTRLDPAATPPREAPAEAPTVASHATRDDREALRAWLDTLPAPATPRARVGLATAKVLLQPPRRGGVTPDAQVRAAVSHLGSLGVALPPRFRAFGPASDGA